MADNEQTYDVDCWNPEGDIVAHHRGVTWEEVEEIRSRYEDEPWITVVVEEA